MAQLVLLLRLGARREEDLLAFHGRVSSSSSTCRAEGKQRQAGSPKNGGKHDERKRRRRESGRRGSVRKRLKEHSHEQAKQGTETQVEVVASLSRHKQSPCLRIALMRPLWAWLALLLFTFVLLAYAQDVNDLTDGEAVNFDLAYGSSATFHLEPPSSSSSNSNVREYYVTLNICSAPSGANFTALDNFDLLFAFTSEDTDIASRADASSADHGYANVTTTTAKSSDKGLWVTVTAPPTNQSGGNDNDEWSFQVAVSTSSPVHVLDRAPLWALQDTDNSSMLLTGPTFFPSLSQSKGGGDPGGDVFIFPTPQDPSISALLQLYKSSCLVQDSDNVIGSDSDQVNSTTTSRGAFTLSAREGALEQAREQHEAGGQRTQLYVTDLEPDTNYTIWGIQSGDGDRNRLFMPQFASTKSSAFHVMLITHKHTRHQLMQALQLIVVACCSTSRPALAWPTACQLHLKCPQPT